MQLIESLAGPALRTPVGLVVVVILSAVLASRLSRLVIRRMIRLLADSGARSGRTQAGFWRVRTTRSTGESGELGERRRRQRIDAASRVLNHLVSLVIWLVAAIAVFHVLGLDAAYFLSSAGFLGAALAIGGQHKVNDYLTGLSVHLEDRYGVGDEIVADVGQGEPVQGVVDNVGLFSTRVREGSATVHLPNHALIRVRNLSQEPVAATLRVRLPDSMPSELAGDDRRRDDRAGVGERVGATLRDLAGTPGLTDVVFVGDLAARHEATGEVAIDVVTSRELADQERSRLVGRTERALRDRG